MTWTAPETPRPIVCGHRGAPALEPENTMVGFEAAAAAGATWVEFDVRPTADAELVIHHDPDTGDGVHIGSTRYRDLDASIPTFGQLAVTKPELGLDIEIKTDDTDMALDAYVELVISQIDAHRPTLENMIVTSFDVDALLLVRERRPDIPTGLLFWDIDFATALQLTIDGGHVAIAPPIAQLQPAWVEEIRGASLDLCTWTVNTPEHIRKAIDLGVDMIIGDDPAAIIERL